MEQFIIQDKCLNNNIFYTVEGDCLVQTGAVALTETRLNTCAGFHLPRVFIRRRSA